ncbi:hypothetical protein IBX65_09485 [Candidatus Aerophobetes bacterium]|nr:hypothetical protein [Candidatus Aerophobetes bacterium]
MKRKSTYFSAGLVVTFLFTLSSIAQGSYLDVTDTGFTRLPISARAMGMGGAFVAVADDYSACYYNPAGLVHLQQRQLGTMYTDLYGLGLLSHSFLSFAEPDMGMGSGALSWSHLSANLEPETWSYDLWAYSYANYLFNREDFFISNSWGINLKYLRQTTPHEDASGYSFDVSYLGKSEKLSWGICIQDVFSRIDWQTGHTDTLPLNIMLGIAFNLNQVALIALDLDVSPTDILRGMRLGGEWELTRNIFFRAGLSQKLQKDENLNFSTGIGLGTDFLSALNFVFNYAFTTSTEFAGTHYLSFSFIF